MYLSRLWSRLLSLANSLCRQTSQRCLVKPILWKWINDDLTLETDVPSSARSRQILKSRLKCWNWFLFRPISMSLSFFSKENSIVSFGFFLPTDFSFEAFSTLRRTKRLFFLNRWKIGLGTTRPLSLSFSLRVLAISKLALFFLGNSWNIDAIYVVLIPYMPCARKFAWLWIGARFCAECHLKRWNELSGTKSLSILH